MYPPQHPMGSKRADYLQHSIPWGRKLRCCKGSLCHHNALFLLNQCSSFFVAVFSIRFGDTRTLVLPPMAAGFNPTCWGETELITCEPLATKLLSIVFSWVEQQMVLPPQAICNLQSDCLLQSSKTVWNLLIMHISSFCIQHYCFPYCNHPLVQYRKSC